MLVKPQAQTDNYDISWIQKQVQCWIYYPNEDTGPIFVKGVIKGIVPLSFNKGNSKVICLLENGGQHETKAMYLEKRRHSNSIEKDLISLEVINPAEILKQLKRRFEDKKIHTYMWNSLIIINPFVQIDDMYDEKVMKHFSDKVINQKKTLSDIQPHIYGFVCNILNNMRVSDKAQMISISGESGSGKTQTNKQCLKIISYVCETNMKTSHQIPTSLIEQRILNCDSVLECFGNAKTSKNDNSSRFGKLITEKINIKSMEILHCEVRVFFLEKSRIIHQIHGQRNFHIFYLLLVYCPQNIRASLGFKNKLGQDLKFNDFAYLGKQIESLREDDKIMWDNLNSALRLLQISEIQKKQIFEVIAAVLHLGNLQFDQTPLTDHEPCQIINDQLLPILANLLMIDEKSLKEGLVFNKKEIAGEVMYLPMTEKQCVQGKDSIAKALYQNLFIWIVEQLNKKVNEHQKPEKHVKIIKMLDIYGFEVFEHNSFEQLCVNYTNERIHQIYLDQVFKHEKNLLKRQGLQSVIPQLKFTDNTKIIELLDTSFKSIYNLLDESCSVNVKDEDFLSNVKKCNEGHQNFPPSNNVTLKKCFIIKHTPGDIEYMVAGFRNKNKDFLREDILQKLSKSKSFILGQKFHQLRQSLKNEANKKFLGFKIRKQVTQLMNEMSFNSDMHFIRCIKPNEQKLPLTFVQRVCYNQIKYLGVLDTVRMRKDCYHVRIPYFDFYKKYGILNSNVQEMIKVTNGQYSDKQCKQMVKSLMDNKFKNTNLDYLFGIDRIFMKMETNTYLEIVLKNKTKTVAHASSVIKVMWRYKHKLNERKNFIVHVKKVQKTIKSFLKDIVLIKRKNAVKIIEREWIKRSEEYFNRKRRIPVMALQKYIKKIIGKKDYESRHHYIEFAKNILSSAISTHKVADKYENYIQMRHQLLGKIYDKIWLKMGQSYAKKIQKYSRFFLNLIHNRSRILTSRQRAYNRQIVKSKQILNKCFKAIPCYKRFERMHGDIIKLQKYIRMATARLNYMNLKSKVIFIQREWRKYKQLKSFNIKYTNRYFNYIGNREIDWKQELYRNLKSNNITSYLEGTEKVLEKFEKVKKDKIILFYYLLDFQLFCDDPSLDTWLHHYMVITEDSLFKLNPVQFLDVADSHTAVATTNKVYTWGFVNGKDTGIQQFQLSQGKFTKISTCENVTKIESINPPMQQKIRLGNVQYENFNSEQDENLNKQWNTVFHTFVLLNGIVLTMQNMSFTKINTPQKVNQLACGMGHVICKTIIKRVYTWGKNTCGQLGTGDYFETNSTNPRSVEYFHKRRIPVCQVAASPDGSIVLDTNSKLYWFGSNGTIKNVCIPEEITLSSKSQFISNHTKYSPVRIISKWSRTMSTIGITIACHDGLLKNQISMRKKVLLSLMTKWNQDINLINPPYSQCVADHISERHMPLPTVYNGPSINKGPSNQQIKDKIISDLQKIQEAERELLKIKKNQNNRRHHF